MSIDFDAISAASQVTPNTAANTKSNNSPVAGSQDYFLKLLVAQMNNQDPLNPLDSAQMTSQLAQLNTVEGINKLSTQLDSLLGTSQSLQASTLVGHTVMAPGNTLALANNEAVGGIELAGAVDTLTVTIKDANGNVIHTADLGKQDGGIVNFVWDGSTTSGVAATAGSYTFSVDAKLAGGTVAANTLSAGVVSSVTPTSGGASLLVSGVGTFDMSQVKQIY